MDRRHLLLLLIGLAVLPSTAALAEDGGDDGSDDSSDDSSDDGGGDDGSDDGGSDDGADDDNGGESGGDDHDSALRAVEDDGALSLEQFLPLFRRQLEGRVVDVSLTDRRGTLLFVVTFINPDGRVRRARFDARTGKLMEQ